MERVVVSAVRAVGAVGFLSLDYVVVCDEVGEDEAVEAVGGGGVEGFGGQAAGGVDLGEGGEVEVCCNYNGVRGEEGLVFEADVLGFDIEDDTGI